MPSFDELPFRDRPDLSPFIFHFTKNSENEDGYTAYDNLVSLLFEGQIWGSTCDKGFIRGPNSATCFMDIPFMSLKYLFTKENTKKERPRYEPYGILITKRFAYSSGARPVLYLSNRECDRLEIPEGEMWRVVRLEGSRNGNWISWLHEREWRKKGNFILPKTGIAAVVKNSKEAKRLSKCIENDKLKCKPNSIIPLSVVSHGLTLM